MWSTRIGNASRTGPRHTGSSERRKVSASLVGLVTSHPRPPMRDYASTSLVNYASLVDAYIVPVLTGIGANSDRMVRQPPSGPPAHGPTAAHRPPVRTYVSKMSLIGQVKSGSTAAPSSVSLLGERSPPPGPARTHPPCACRAARPTPGLRRNLATSGLCRAPRVGYRWERRSPLPSQGALRRSP